MNHETASRSQDLIARARQVLPAGGFGNFSAEMYGACWL